MKLILGHWTSSASSRAHLPREPGEQYVVEPHVAHVRDALEVPAHVAVVDERVVRAVHQAAVHLENVMSRSDGLVGGRQCRLTRGEFHQQIIAAFGKIIIASKNRRHVTEFYQRKTKAVFGVSSDEELSTQNILFCVR